MWNFILRQLVIFFFLSACNTIIYVSHDIQQAIPLLSTLFHNNQEHLSLAVKISGITVPHIQDMFSQTFSRNVELKWFVKVDILVYDKTHMLLLRHWSVPHCASLAVLLLRSERNINTNNYKIFCASKCKCSSSTDVCTQDCVHCSDWSKGFVVLGCLKTKSYKQHYSKMSHQEGRVHIYSINPS